MVAREWWHGFTQEGNHDGRGVGMALDTRHAVVFNESSSTRHPYMLRVRYPHFKNTRIRIDAAYTQQPHPRRDKLDTARAATCPATATNETH